MQRVPSITNSFIVHHIVPGAPLDSGNLEKIRECAVLCEEVGVESLSASLLPKGCLRIRVPILSSTLFWPLSQANTWDEPEPPDFPNGRFPQGDSFIVNCVDQNAPVRDIMLHYSSGQWFPSWPSLGALFDSEEARLSNLDAKSDVNIGSYIMKRYTKERLFWSSSGPTNVLLAELLYQIMQFYRKKRSVPHEIDANILGLPEIFGSFSVPIHPAVRQQFGLDWYDPGQLFNYFDIDHFSSSEYFRKMLDHSYKVKHSRSGLESPNGIEKTARETYVLELSGTKEFFSGVDVSEVPSIFHYWANKHLRPMMNEAGFSSSDDFFFKYLTEVTRRNAVAEPQFASIGAGDCSNEITLAGSLRRAGLRRFKIECLELSEDILSRARAAASEAGVSEYLEFTSVDINVWRPSKIYDSIIAKQSLHHVVNLEGLFGAIRDALSPSGYFLVDDMIGRNGHMRWPEALKQVHTLWRELPMGYRYNHLLRRHEDLYENWDCSSVAFEGIRAQDVLPLLVERFDFEFFMAFGNITLVFVDRTFGYNFDPERDWDRTFIDRVHALDEQLILDGTLTPTQMFAALTPQLAPRHVYSRGLSPAQSIRIPDA